MSRVFSSFGYWYRDQAPQWIWDHLRTGGRKNKDVTAPLIRLLNKTKSTTVAGGGENKERKRRREEEESSGSWVVRVDVDMTTCLYFRLWSAYIYIMYMYV
eukprot:GHVS01031899.1.p1 GENE.GHVS01031899.1~~GHVS01031899.1.p1  ORF type:complete len:101 (+),score=15.17 GHVS01031899.1:116-418(+)